ncbi:hypothetical protein C6P46_004051 [Rhodotorula mucilaginosa]|uniref:Uncharacterized protein n=1 Tax=Rhodotorula mucilaginosa TaxID=5537 RepID=A0A9P6W1Q9_RHOMI|nr:hypothetical protein C6P46_004051 [Rhodotorula mucilaginosa]
MEVVVPVTTGPMAPLRDRARVGLRWVSSTRSTPADKLVPAAWASLPCLPRPSNAPDGYPAETLACKTTDECIHALALLLEDAAAPSFSQATILPRAPRQFPPPPPASSRNAPGDTESDCFPQTRSRPLDYVSPCRNRTSNLRMAGDALFLPRLFQTDSGFGETAAPAPRARYQKDIDLGRR